MSFGAGLGALASGFAQGMALGAQIRNQQEESERKQALFSRQEKEWAKQDAIENDLNALPKQVGNGGTEITPQYLIDNHGMTQEQADVVHKAIRANPSIAMDVLNGAATRNTPAASMQPDQDSPSQQLPVAQNPTAQTVGLTEPTPAATFPVANQGEQPLPTQEVAQDQQTSPLQDAQQSQPTTTPKPAEQGPDYSGKAHYVTDDGRVMLADKSGIRQLTPDELLQRHAIIYGNHGETEKSALLHQKASEFRSKRLLDDITKINALPSLQAKLDAAGQMLENDKTNPYGKSDAHYSINEDGSFDIGGKTFKNWDEFQPVLQGYAGWDGYSKGVELQSKLAQTRYHNTMADIQQSMLADRQNLLRSQVAKNEAGALGTTVKALGGDGSAQGKGSGKAPPVLMSFDDFKKRFSAGDGGADAGLNWNSAYGAYQQMVKHNPNADPADQTWMADTAYRISQNPELIKTGLGPTGEWQRFADNGNGQKIVVDRNFDPERFVKDRRAIHDMEVKWLEEKKNSDPQVYNEMVAVSKDPNKLGRVLSLTPMDDSDLSKQRMAQMISRVNSYSKANQPKVKASSGTYQPAKTSPQITANVGVRITPAGQSLLGAKQFVYEYPDGTREIKSGEDAERAYILNK